VHRIVEGIEHHFDASHLEQIEGLVSYIDAHPDWWDCFLTGSHAPASAPKDLSDS
jgi:hypothetical protein